MIMAMNPYNAAKKHQTESCDQRSYGESIMLTKIALAAALIIGPASATLANDNAGNASKHARASYAQAHVRTSPNVDSTPSTEPTATVRPLTQFEKNWFDYQDHE
jgi:hypothetical protein